MFISNHASHSLVISSSFPNIQRDPCNNSNYQALEWKIEAKQGETQGN